MPEESVFQAAHYTGAAVGSGGGIGIGVVGSMLLKKFLDKTNGKSSENSKEMVEAIREVSNKLDILTGVVNTQNGFIQGWLSRQK